MSSIKQKYGICIDCTDNKEVPIIAGRCQMHYKLFRYKISKDKKNKILTIKKPIKKGTKVPIIGLNLWFEYHMTHSKRECENCGTDLSHYSKEDWFSSQDHIIEKSTTNGCPSVATVLENHCVLGKWCCHGQKHTSQLNLSKMKIFPLLKERFEKFKHLIVKEEIKKIPNIFL